MKVLVATEKPFAAAAVNGKIWTAEVDGNEVVEAFAGYYHAHSWYDMP